MPNSTPVVKEDPYTFLTSFDTVFLIDDSGSMAGRSWRELLSFGAVQHIDVNHNPTMLNKPLATGFKKQWVIPGKVGGVATTAFPDSGSTRDGVSKTFLEKHFPKNKIEYYSVSSIQLPNGAVVRTLGEIKIPFQFEGESFEHIRSFAVLPSCVHDVVLGKTFLRLTRTLTRFTRRLKEIVVKCVGTSRLHLMGRSEEEFFGQVDGYLTSACPDTGSDIMAMSSLFAQQRGHDVDTSPHNIIQVQYADGSFGWTQGKASNVNWKFRFGSSADGSYNVDFYVLDDLPCNLILSNEFLFDNDVFQRYEKHFICFDSEDNEDDDVEGLFMIQRVSESLRSRFKKLIKSDPPLGNSVPHML